MNCEEFGNAWLDRDMDAGEADTEAAREHLRHCARCGALYESSLSLRADLRELGRLTADASTPSRVEMRLRQEFRTRHQTDKHRDRAVVAGWVLAAATMLLIASSVVLWQRHRLVSIAQIRQAPATVIARTVASGPELGETLIAESDGEEFALIPGAIPGLQDETSVVRVQMQRGSLSALGLSVNEEHASDIVQVDLLLGADGQPQAYRLPGSNN